MSDCQACYGTGRFQGKFAGPGWPNCPECNGTGKEDGPSEDTMLQRRIDACRTALKSADPAAPGSSP